MQAKFNEEREFFLENAQKGQNNSNDLQNRIKQLQNEIEEERHYSAKVWANEQVSLLCQKAFFSFKYTQQEQQGIISGIDVRDRPEGHIVVTKEEQNAVLKSQIAAA